MQSIGPMGALVIGAGVLGISIVAIAFGMAWFRKFIHAKALKTPAQLELVFQSRSPVH
jgi:hypothetical protein